MGKDSGRRPHPDSIFAPGGVARFAKWHTEQRHPLIAAHDAAVQALSDAGLPTAPGLYRIGSGSLRLIGPEDEIAPPAACLSKAALKLGHAPGSAVHRAAQIVEQYDKMMYEASAGRIWAALAAACRIGALSVEQRADQDAGIGRKVRQDGKKRGAAQADHVTHQEWFMRDCALEAKGLRPTERAREIAKELGYADPNARETIRMCETIRKRVREMRPQKRA